MKFREKEPTSGSVLLIAIPYLNQPLPVVNGVGYADVSSSEHGSTSLTYLEGYIANLANLVEQVAGRAVEGVADVGKVAAPD